jgi:O-antigen/teichoic acid export membrane protein
MFKAFGGPAQSLMESNEKQHYIIAATVFAGIVDIGVAWYLIPAHAAVGACIGNGAAQLTAVALMWSVSIYLYKIRLPWMLVGKVAFCSLMASLTAYFVAMRLAPLAGILAGGGAALFVLFGLFYLLRVLEPEDHSRLRILTGMLPKPLAGLAGAVLLLMIRKEADSMTPTSG